MVKKQELVILRGGGDLATGVAQKLWRAGFSLLVLETDCPTAIRRSVAISEAVYEGRWQVEDIVCQRITRLEERQVCWRQNAIPLLVDPGGEAIGQLQPFAVVDAILAKRNLGTHRHMADVTIGLGPGFTAGQDVDAVIETMRGHDLGRLILQGQAMPNTGIPGEIGGQGAKRVLHAPASGVMRHIRQLGDVVRKEEALFAIGDQVMKAPFDGLLRGLLREGLHVPQGMKVADVDPRCDVDWHTISDKARCLGGAVLEALLYLRRRQVGGTRNG